MTSETLGGILQGIVSNNYKDELKRIGVWGEKRGARLSKSRRDASDIWVYSYFQG